MMKKMRKVNSIKSKVVLLDVLIVFPLFILFCVLTIVIFKNSNYELNKSKVDVLEERANNIANRNIEIIKITNMLYLDSKINRLLSKKNQLTGYELIDAQNEVQSKMREITELFPERQYQLMILCSNGSNYFQTSLGLNGKSLTLDDVKEENWYQEVDEKSDAIYFLPQYRSSVLQKLFKEDTLFAVRNIRNLNSGRIIGTMIVAISKDIWGNDVLNAEEDRENTIVIDQYRKIIYSSDSELYDSDAMSDAHFQRIITNTKGFFCGYIKKKYCHIRFDSIGETGWKIIAYEPYQRNWSLYVMLNLGLGVVMLVVLIAIVFYNCSFISRRMRRLNKNILEVSEGNLKTRIYVGYEREFRDVSLNFNKMLDKIEQLMQQLEKEEKEKHILEIQTLQAQINPHFFYNTLVTIRFMIQMEEYQDADRAILAFSKLLRKSFANSHKIIPIKEELSMVEEYLQLMLLRYKNKFQWKIIIDHETAELGILKNVIQPLVENSISHGFNMKQEMGHILIRVHRKLNSIIIEVEDDGVGGDLEKINSCIQSCELPNVKEQFSGIGISNIQMRISRNFGEQYGLQVDVNDLGGLTFKMEIPVIKVGGERSEHCNCGR